MKVSIIVPVYNVEVHLRKSLDSLINQNFTDYEIILINDGSTDNSPVILEEYAKKYPEKILVYHEKNSGQAVARNLGLSKARGDYIMFVDSDDYIDKNTLKVTYDKAQETMADIVCFGIYLVYDNEIKTKEFHKLKIADDVRRYILTNDGPCNKLIKTELIKKNNLYFPKLRAYEDIAVVPAYGIFAKKIVWVDECFYYYLMRTGSTMKQTVYSDKLLEIFASMQNLVNIFIENGWFKQYYYELEFLLIHHLLHGAGLRFIKFDNYEDNLDKIIKMIKHTFPKWSKNIYYKKQTLKYRIICQLLFKKQIKLLAFLRKSR